MSFNVLPCEMPQFWYSSRLLAAIIHEADHIFQEMDSGFEAYDGHARERPLTRSTVDGPAGKS